MTRHFAGVIQSCEPSGPQTNTDAPATLLLRPADHWLYPIYIRKSVHLVLPDGRSFETIVRGGEIMTSEPRAILVELIPEIDNEIPAGTRLYVDEYEPGLKL